MASKFDFKCDNIINPTEITSVDYHYKFKILLQDTANRQIRRLGELNPAARLYCLHLFQTLVPKMLAAANAGKFRIEIDQVEANRMLSTDLIDWYKFIFGRMGLVSDLINTVIGYLGLEFGYHSPG